MSKFGRASLPLNSNSSPERQNSPLSFVTTEDMRLPKTSLRLEAAAASSNAAAELRRGVKSSYEQIGDANVRLLDKNAAVYLFHDTCFLATMSFARKRSIAIKTTGRLAVFLLESSVGVRNCFLRSWDRTVCREESLI